MSDYDVRSTNNPPSRPRSGAYATGDHLFQRRSDEHGRSLVRNVALGEAKFRRLSSDKTTKVARCVFRHSSAKDTKRRRVITRFFQLENGEWALDGNMVTGRNLRPNDSFDLELREYCNRSYNVQWAVCGVIRRGPFPPSGSTEATRRIPLQELGIVNADPAPPVPSSPLEDIAATGSFRNGLHGKLICFEKTCLQPGCIGYSRDPAGPVARSTEEVSRARNDAEDTSLVRQTKPATTTAPVHEAARPYPHQPTANVAPVALQPVAAQPSTVCTQSAAQHAPLGSTSERKEETKVAVCIYISEQRTAHKNCHRWFRLEGAEQELALDCAKVTGLKPLREGTRHLLDLRRYEGNVHHADWVVRHGRPNRTPREQIVATATYVGDLSRSGPGMVRGVGLVRQFRLEDGSFAVDCSKKTGVFLQKNTSVSLVLVAYTGPNFNAKWTVKGLATDGVRSRKLSEPQTASPPPPANHVPVKKPYNATVSKAAPPSRLHPFEGRERRTPFANNARHVDIQAEGRRASCAADYGNLDEDDGGVYSDEEEDGLRSREELPSLSANREDDSEMQMWYPEEPAQLNTARDSCKVSGEVAGLNTYSPTTSLSGELWSNLASGINETDPLQMSAEEVVSSLLQNEAIAAVIAAHDNRIFKMMKSLGRV